MVYVSKGVRQVHCMENIVIIERLGDFQSLLED